MPGKRPLHQISPEAAANGSAKKSSYLLYKIANGPKTSVSTNMELKDDAFSWKTLCDLLDAKLHNVAKKDDLAALQTEIQQLRNENLVLKSAVLTLERKLESVDKSSRRTNVIVNGLKSQSSSDASTEFEGICRAKLKTTTKIATVRKMRNGRGFIFGFDSVRDTEAIIAARKALKGTKIFINRDLTENERQTRVKLANIAKTLEETDNQLKVRYTDFSVFVNDIHLSMHNNKMQVNDTKDAEFLKNIFEKANLAIEIVATGKKVNKKQLNTPQIMATPCSSSMISSQTTRVVNTRAEE